MGSSRYVLMHKNVPVIGCMFEDGYFSGFYCDFNLDHLPLGTKRPSGRCDRGAFMEWFARRSVPRTRENIKTAFLSLHNPGTNQLMLNSFALGLADQYWLKPANAEIDWHEVNFFENSFSSELADIFFGSKDSVSFDGTLVGPDSCSCGDDVKAWRIIDGVRWLAKQGGTFHQEPYNEVFGSRLSKLFGASAAEYRVVVDDEDVYSLSRCMTTGDTELVTAYDIFKEYHLDSVDSVQRAREYIKVLEQNGVADAGADIGKMCLVDFLIKNEDRHWTNFGVIRDANTLAWLGTMPLFDFGNSMCFDDDVISSKDVTGRFTRRRLYEDLEFAPGVSGYTLEEAVWLAERVYGEADGMRMSRRYQLVDVLKERADTLSRRVGMRGLSFHDEIEL